MRKLMEFLCGLLVLFGLVILLGGCLGALIRGGW